ncbi:MAG TPA: hypothetical protein VMT94_09175 [Burkholderiales bacterium]|nr:hypothetical protein [Burkholderiales bacterium]
MTATYLAAMMDAETGSNQSYQFEGEPDLFHKPADDIVDAFIQSLDGFGDNPAPLSYELNSAIKKSEKQVVLATGSLHVERGEIPFLLLISPAREEKTA